MSDNQDSQAAFKRLKLEVDVVKHLSTLNTGSILIVATFLDKLGKSVLHPERLAFSLLCLVCSLGACVIYLMTPWVQSKQARVISILNSLLFLAACLLFFVGIMFLGVEASSALVNIRSTSK